LLVTLASDACEQLTCFQLHNAHCYDPNEEAKLRLVIGSLGNNVFTERVRTLGQAVVAKAKFTLVSSVDGARWGEAIQRSCQQWPGRL